MSASPALKNWFPAGNAVSVIVPVHDARNTLERCVKSVLSQTHRDIQLVLVDDGSTDGSDELCDEIAAGDGRAVSMHQGNAGPGAARNTALDHAEGDWIMFVDADDWIEPDYIEHMLGLACEEKAQMVVGDCIMEEAGGPRRFGMVVPDMSYESKRDLLQDFLSSRIPWSLWGKLFAAALFKDLRFRPEDYIAEDLDVVSRIIVRDDLRLVTTSLAGYHYRIADGSVDHSFTRRHLCQFDVFERVVGLMHEQRVETETSPEVFYEERVLNCWRKAIDCAALGDDEVVSALERACALHRGDVLHDPNAPKGLKRRLWATCLGLRAFARFHSLRAMVSTDQK